MDLVHFVVGAGRFFCASCCPCATPDPPTEPMQVIGKSISGTQESMFTEPAKLPD
jgi:hypothetical protein